MHYEVGKSYAWFQAWGRGYYAVFAYPGNRRTRILCRDDKPIVFPTYVEAIAAAQMQVRKVCEPDIRTHVESEETIGTSLAAEAEAHMNRKARDMAQAIAERRFTRQRGRERRTIIEIRGKARA